MPIRPEHRRYYGPAWRAFRAERIAAAGGRCQRCARAHPRLNGAHTTHDPRDLRHVAVWCPSCHARNDAGHRQAVQRRNWRAASRAKRPALALELEYAAHPWWGPSCQRRAARAAGRIVPMMPQQKCPLRAGLAAPPSPPPARVLRSGYHETVVKRQLMAEQWNAFSAARVMNKAGKGRQVIKSCIQRGRHGVFCQRRDRACGGQVSRPHATLVMVAFISGMDRVAWNRVCCRCSPIILRSRENRRRRE